MAEVTVREGCAYRDFNIRRGASCTEDDLCSGCWMERDIAEHPEMYEAFAAELGRP